MVKYDVSYASRRVVWFQPREYMLIRPNEKGTAMAEASFDGEERIMPRVNEGEIRADGEELELEWLLPYRIGGGIEPIYPFFSGAC